MGVDEHGKTDRGATAPFVALRSTTGAVLEEKTLFL